MMATEERPPCPATHGRKVCCYTEGHIERGGFLQHRFVEPDPAPSFGEVIAEIITAKGFVKYDLLATEDMGDREQRLWRETGKIDTGEDDAA